MQSITHSLSDILYKVFKSNGKTNSILDSLIAPMVFNQSTLSYSGLISHIDYFNKQIGRELLKTILEKMDESFNNSSGRVDRYYVKHYRERTIITLFGPVTYKRREYIDRTTKKPFIYVDREIGLFGRQRYDICVCALAYEMYSEHNSMIKVGKLLGERILPFTLNKAQPQYVAIPRQTIYNMNNRFKLINTPINKRENTPDTVYIMADEKYIHLQGERNINDDPHKRYYEMVKVGVIFTGREEVTDKNGASLKIPRWKLTGKHIITYPDKQKNFWQHTSDTLNDLFDMEKVKNIYILGDGAHWIKTGVNELKTSTCSTSFALDRFHLSKAVHKLTKEKEHRKILIDYAIHNKRKDFKTFVDKIFPLETRTEKLQSLIDYITNNMHAASIMYKKVKIGCAMEQAIQHIIASNFSSVPKAYGREHLHTYVNARTLQQNGYNMVLTYIQAADVFKKTNEEYIDLSKENLDLSFFDELSSNPYYKLHYNPTSFKEYTKF